MTLLKQFRQWIAGIEDERANGNFLNDSVDLKAEDKTFVSQDGSRYTISIGTIQDVSDLLRVQKESYGTIQWQRYSLNHDFLINQHSLYLVARDKTQKAVAFIGVWMKNKEVHITNICVSSDYQRQGLASYLIELMAKVAKEKDQSVYTLEVRASNQHAISLYKKRGFSEAGKRIGYYKDNGEDALNMERSLRENQKESYA